MSLFDKLILGVCLLHPVFLRDVLDDVIGVISKYSAKAIFACRLTRCVFSKAENLGRFFMIHPEYWLVVTIGYMLFT